MPALARAMSASAAAKSFQPTGPEQVANIVVAAKGGTPVYLRQVADVVPGHDIRRGAVTADGRGEIVLGLGFMLMGENSHTVTRALKKKLEEIEHTLPPGVKVVYLYDRTELVDHVIDTVGLPRPQPCASRTADIDYAPHRHDRLHDGDDPAGRIGGACRGHILKSGIVEVHIVHAGEAPVRAATAISDVPGTLPGSADQHMVLIPANIRCRPRRPWAAW